MDINKAIIDNVNLVLVNTEFKNVKFSSTSIEENIIRPSFYLYFDNNKTNKFNHFLKERNLNVRLFYFAKSRDNSKIELLKIQDTLENLFLKVIKVNDDFYFNVGEVEFDVNKKDGYLTVDLELYSLEEIEIIDDSEYADEIIFNQKIN